MKLFKFRQHEKSRAQAMVEFMLALPVLLLLIYGIVEVARLIFIYSSVTNASRQAARYGAASGLNSDGIPRFQDCDGIRAVANRSAFLVQFDEINITYDRGVASDGTQIPISGIDPSPHNDTCPIPFDNVHNGDRIIVQVVTTYEPIITIVPLEPFPIAVASARTFLTSVPILGSAVPVAFAAETSTPSRTPTPLLSEITSTPTPFQTPTSSIIVTRPPLDIPPFPHEYTPTSVLLPTITATQTAPPPPTFTPTVTLTAINCIGATSLAHGPLTIADNVMSMDIINTTGYTVSSAAIYLEWNHDTGHEGSDPTLHVRQVALGNSTWSGDVFAPFTFFHGFYPPIPPDASTIKFFFNQAYTNTDGSERIIITLSTPGCVNYPIDSSK